MRRAAKVYAVTYSTLRGRMVLGRKRKDESHVKELKLSPTEEKSIVKWITSLDNRGFQPRVKMVVWMARKILVARGRQMSWESN